MINMEVNTWAGFDQILENIIKDTLKEVGQKVEVKLKDWIDQDVYAIGSPEMYENTYQLRDSVISDEVENNGDGFSINIGHDTEKIIYNKDKVQHGSSYDISEWIPEIVAFNKSGLRFGNGWWMHRNNYFYDCLNNLKESGEISTWFKEGLRRRGIKI